jgi:hypothetical protein
MAMRVAGVASDIGLIIVKATDPGAYDHPYGRRKHMQRE